MPELIATFVRRRGARDEIHVRRSNGTEVSWPFPTYGDLLPHDLVHLVVEAGLDLRDGFWGRVDRGADPFTANGRAERAGGAGRYAGFGDDLNGLWLAEELVGAPRWLDPEVDEAAQLAALAPLRPTTGDDVRAVRRALAALGARWRAAARTGALTLRFDAAAPRRGFERLLEELAWRS